MNRGFFIVLEGTEGVGKSTQAQMLSKALLSRRKPTPWSKVVTTLEPGGTAIGQTIREMVRYANVDPLTRMILYQADRAEHVQKIVKPSLENNAVVICDRYTHSTVAYQHYGQGFSQDIIDSFNAISTKELKADLTIWLDGSVEFYLNRSNERDGKDADIFQQQNIDFHKSVYRGYQALSKTEPKFERVGISAEHSRESIHKKVLNIVINYLGEHYGYDW